MEKDTGAKIIIRGKGSVKEGKVGRKDGQPLPGEDEPLHAFITAANLDCVKKAVEKINEVIKQGIEVPEGHNDLRRMQLRELAQLNGTLRETDGPRCQNCGSSEHKSWLCPDKPNVTNNIMCSSCGGAGHIAKDCKGKRPGQGGPPSADDQAKIDEEYLSLMAELGEGPPPSKNKDNDAPQQTQSNRNNFSIFDRPSAPRAITGSHHSHHSQQHQSNSVQMQPQSQPAPPPPQPPQPLMSNQYNIPPLMQPPPPLMPNQYNWNQPLPPGSDMPLPPGTGGPLPNIVPPPPPPPGTSTSMAVSLIFYHLNKLPINKLNFSVCFEAMERRIIVKCEHTISVGKWAQFCATTSSATECYRFVHKIRFHFDSFRFNSIEYSIQFQDC